MNAFCKFMSRNGSYVSINPLSIARVTEDPEYAPYSHITMTDGTIVKVAHDVNYVHEMIRLCLKDTK